MQHFAFDVYNLTTLKRLRTASVISKWHDAILVPRFNVPPGSQQRAGPPPDFNIAYDTGDVL